MSIRDYFSSIDKLRKFREEAEILRLKNEQLLEQNRYLEQLKHSTTLEELEDKPQDIEILQGASPEYRLALYRFLTARAYRLNKDDLRASALWTRTDLMKVTKGEKNAIPFDRDVHPKKPADFLPSVLHDPTNL